MTVRYQADYAGIGELLQSEQMQAEMRSRAERVAAIARATAPVDYTGPHPGRYRDSIVVSSGVKHEQTSRAYGRVTATAPEAVFVEFGSQNNAAHHTLLRALDGAS